MMGFGRILILTGLALVILGGIAVLLERSNLPLGRLPGDVTWRGKNTTFYFPVMTCLVLSVILSLVLWLVNRR
jgi:hypothetical protein